MAFEVIKKTQTHCVVAVTGTGANTINISTDLALAAETPSSPEVSISGLFWAIPGAAEATLTRNGQMLYKLLGNYDTKFENYNDPREKASNIVVTMPAGGGTVFLQLVKNKGYGNEQHRNQGI